MVLPATLLSFQSTLLRKERSFLSELEVIIEQISMESNNAAKHSDPPTGEGEHGDDPVNIDELPEDPGNFYAADEGSRGSGEVDLDSSSHSSAASSDNSSTTSSDEEHSGSPPVAKRRRSLGESDEAVHLFGLKLAAAAARSRQNSMSDADTMTRVSNLAANRDSAIVSQTAALNRNSRPHRRYIPHWQRRINRGTATTPGSSGGRSGSDLHDNTEDFSISSLSSLSMISSDEAFALTGHHSHSVQREHHLLQSLPDDEEFHLPSLSPSPPPHFDVEFEVASLASFSSNPIEDANSSSGLDDVHDGGYGNGMEARLGSSDGSLTDETEHFADEEETDHSDDGASVKTNIISDSELSDKDMWNCTQCHAKTNNPYLRYCLRCFRIRRNWLPKRPAQKKNKKSKSAAEAAGRRTRSQNRRHTSSEEEMQNSQSQEPAAPGTTAAAATLETSTHSSNVMNNGFIEESSPASTTTTTCPNTTTTSDTSSYNTSKNVDMVDCSGSSLKSSTTTPSTSTSDYGQSVSHQEGGAGLDVVDSGIPKNKGPIFNTTTTTTTTSAAATEPPPPTTVVSAQILQDILRRSPIKIKSIRRSPSSSVEERQPPVCSVCMVRDKDAAFVHGKTAHVYSCYNCADKILKKNGKCPICRKRILRVVKVITS